MSKKLTTEEFYKRLYGLFDGVTPLKKDCGILCDGACCKEEAERTGMLLFPGEDKVLQNADFGEIEPCNCYYGEEETKGKIFFCNFCNRSLRPLACRIFPLMPYKKEGSSLKIIMNPMAKNMCPLARSLKVSQLEPKFVKNVRRAMNNILKLRDGEDYIIMLSEIADEYIQTQKKFMNKKSD
jgi:hypothetical protein